MYKFILVIILFVFKVLASLDMNSPNMITCGFYTGTLPPSSTSPCPTFGFSTETTTNNIKPTEFIKVLSRYNKNNRYKKTKCN